MAPQPNTRRALLRAGRRLFADRGYPRTTVRALTQEAKANLGAVTYHFESKRGLYEAVLEEVLSPLIDQLKEAVELPDPAQAIRAFVEIYLRYLHNHEETPRLMLQELAAGSTPPAAVRRLVATVTGGIGGVIKRGQDAGVFRPGHPALMALSLVAQPIQLTLASRRIGPTLGFDPSNDEDFEMVRKHIVAFTLGGFGYRERAP